VHSELTSGPDPTPPAAAATAGAAATAARREAPQAITVAGLRKNYGAVRAVRDVNFSVAHGEIVALLGPNGAGRAQSTRASPSRCRPAWRSPTCRYQARGKKVRWSSRPPSRPQNCTG
jgi:ABC-type glutathione transport system ATPase component